VCHDDDDDDDDDDDNHAIRWDGKKVSIIVVLSNNKTSQLVGNELRKSRNLIFFYSYLEGRRSFGFYYRTLFCFCFVFAGGCGVVRVA
jgi:hypothetical protein